MREAAAGAIGAQQECNEGRVKRDGDRLAEGQVKGREAPLTSFLLAQWNCAGSPLSPDWAPHPYLLSCLFWTLESLVLSFSSSLLTSVPTVLPLKVGPLSSEGKAWLPL